MPNWCDNKMFIRHGDSEMIRQAAVAFNEGRLLDFFCPMPEFEDHDAWYDWRCQHWGTKWDIDNGDDKLDVTRAVKDKSFNANFSTAWRPPIGALEKAKELGFEITNSYSEDNMGIAGVWDDGEDR